MMLHENENFLQFQWCEKIVKSLKNRHSCCKSLYVAFFQQLSLVHDFVNQFPFFLSACFLTTVFIFAQFFNSCCGFFLISVEKHLTWCYWLNTDLHLLPVVGFLFVLFCGVFFKTGRMSRPSDVSELPAKIHQLHQQEGIFFQRNMKIKN